MNPEVRLVAGASLSAYADRIRRVYAEVFSAPPWDEDEAMAGLYVERLADDALRPGFTAALACDGDTVAGFATAWSTPDSFPQDRSYGAVAAALGPERTTAWLCGGLEVDELAVAARARGTGLGAALLAAVTDQASDGRCWLLTSVRAQGALRFYRRAGWYELPVVVPGKAGLTVLLGPRHPGRPDLA
ncbi:GNAT family N-acetyltransferase [Streptomyces sp. NPDC057136]|uniref:GNAT family N-acetyltransferase n=1 Tax=Streptomyces sp. NPDC057136 TaxID=3346029 RepID=UPI00362FF678